MANGMSEGSPRLGVGVAGEEELASILRLVTMEYQPPVTSEAYWRWRYFGNPVAKVTVYVARNDAGEVVALQPVSEYSMIVGGRPRRARLLTGAITHPAYRRRGLFRRLIDRIDRDLEQQGEFFIYTFPNEMSVKGFRRFAGWHQRELLTLYVRPLSPWSLRGRAVDLPAMGAASRALSDEQRARVTLREVDSFDEETDGLLSVGLRADAVYVRRSREYLNWRYTANPTAQYVICSAEKDGKLAGYLVFRERLLFGLRTGLIADLVASDGWVASSLIRRAIRSARARRLSVLALLGGRYIPNLSSLYANGFLPVPRLLLRRRFYLYVYSGSGAESRLFDAIASSPWLVTWGDIDVV